MIKIINFFVTCKWIKILHAKIVPLSIVSNVAMHEVQLTFKPNIFPVVNVAKVHDHL